MTQSATALNPTHRFSLNGVSLLACIGDNEAIAAFVTEQIAKGANPADLKVDALEQAPKSEPRVIKVGEYDVIGDARSQTDRDAAKAAGFAPARPVYRQGLRATGMERHRAEFEALPLARDAANALVRTVVAEAREDVTLEKKNVQMTNDGHLWVGPTTVRLEDRAMKQLVSRLGMPTGAGQYLPEIRPAMRADNVNDWVKTSVIEAEQHRIAELKAKRKDVTLDLVSVRTRRGDDGQRDAFAIVSDDYTPFDADKIGAALALAVPEGARAAWSYDGQRTKFDVQFFTDVPVEEAVAGEFFKAFARVRTDDTGGGSIVISAGLMQNLCLNFIILDEAVQPVARIRHIGSVRKLADKFQESFAVAQEKIKHFTKAWGYSVQDDVVSPALALAAVQGAVTRDEAQDWAGRPAREVLAGLYNGIIERDLVPLPKRDRKAVVNDLLVMWDRDVSSARKRPDVAVSRAAVVNGLTRYAHEVNRDSFKEHAIESAASGLLFKDAPLPFLPITV